MTRLFAEGTAVPADRSRGEIESMLRRYGATAFAYMTSEGKAAVGFKAHGRNVRFVLPLPSKDDPALATKHSRKRWVNGRYVAVIPDEKVAAEVRRRWRALALAIKAKLECVESGIESFEQAFLAQIVLPSGETVSEAVLPRIEDAYATGKPVLLLGEGQ